MLWLPWKRQWSVTRSRWTTVSWPALTSPPQRARTTWRAWRPPGTTPGSTARPWPSSPDRYAQLQLTCADAHTTVCMLSFSWFTIMIFKKTKRLLGLLQSLRHHARRPRHARHLWRFPQHRQSGGAYGGWEAEELADPPQRLHPGIPTASPTHPRWLPGTRKPANVGLNVGDPDTPWRVLCFQLTGQPVLIGGTMGTCSYVLTGTEQGMTETFGTTCHGAVRQEHRYWRREH